MKKVILLFVLCISFLFSSCSLFKDTTQEAKDEFSKYYNGKNDVVLYLFDWLYFEENTLELNEISLFSSVAVVDQKVYYASVITSHMGYVTQAIEVYSCDYSGENTQLVYSKMLGGVFKFDFRRKDFTYYITYKKDGIIYIDAYDIATGNYTNVEQGENCQIRDYATIEWPQPDPPSKYNVEVIDTTGYKDPDRGKFIITDTETGEQRIIDDSYLQDTVYIESMQKFAYSVERFDISNGHILLSYGIGAGDAWNYAYLVFDYNFEDDTLEYKLLAFPYKKLGVDIWYIGE